MSTFTIGKKNSALIVGELADVMNELAGKGVGLETVSQAIYELCRQVHEATDRVVAALEKR